jgi:two-component system, LuxR family, response regulator FixJ
VSSADEVVVIEDDAGMRDALSLLLRNASFRARCFASAEEFLADVEPSDSLCLITDLRLPGMDGLALYRHLVSIGAETAVIVIIGHGDIPIAVAALKNGVMDFVEKPFDPGILLDSVHEAAQRAGERKRRRAAAAEVDRRLQLLTAREKEILSLLVEGHPNKVIAATLGISIRTSEHHRARVMEKMRARTLSQLIKVTLGLGD